MNKKSIWIIAGVAVLAVTVAILTMGKTPSTVKIVALYPMTGGLASWGESAQNGSIMAVEAINKNGGINGKTLEVVYQDHKCDPKLALSVYKQSLSQSKIFLSSSCSGTVLGVAPNLKNDNATLLATVVASAKISGVAPEVYRNWTIETNQSQVVAKEIKDKGYKKIGIIFEQTDYAKGLAASLENNLKDSGITVVSDSFVTGATDVRTQLAKLKAEGVEALFIAPQTETSSEVILSQMEEIKFAPKLVVNDIILGASKLIAKHLQLLQGARGGNFIVQSDKLEAFLAAYKARFGTDCGHTGACAVAYDSVNILADAIKKNGDTAQGVESYLKSLNYQGVSRATAFDQKNDRVGADYLLSEIGVDGKVTQVK